MMAALRRRAPSMLGCSVVSALYVIGFWLDGTVLLSWRSMAFLGFGVVYGWVAAPLEYR